VSAQPPPPDPGGGPRNPSARSRYEWTESLLKGGGVGIALVAAATGALVVVAALIAVIVAALY
jgi:hypothetical protein